MVWTDYMFILRHRATYTNYVAHSFNSVKIEEFI